MSAARAAPDRPAGPGQTADLARLLAERHIVVCCGPGGVGKTTTAAALAVRAADEGRRVIVCTIDPARRLAQSLGLDALDNTPRPVPPRAFRGRRPRGELWAMMLDMKRTFDEMILDMTTPERAERIFANPFYRHVSSTLAGTQEYMAMEKLWELHEEGRWELIVLDTPPTRSALDFLDAPKRVTDFLEGRFLRLLLWPYLQAGKTYLKAVSLGARAFLRVATRITGSELLEDVANFFLAFEGMYDTFKQRARRVYELLAARRTAFVIVATPHEAALREARYFLDRLAAERMPLGGVVLNRTHAVPALESVDDAEALAEKARAAGDGALLAAALELHASWRRVSLREEAAVAAALGDPPGVPLWRVPELPDEVHDVPALRRVGDALMGSGGAATTG
jgi:anion-transporting  ArsA/GET3 family ATPase